MDRKTGFTRQRRAKRTRFAVRSKSQGKPRLSVFRSNRHIYAQIIDDGAGHTLVAAASSELDPAPDADSSGKTSEARRVGALVAERASGKGISGVVFDRGPYLYHGRVRALAEAAREAGLKF